MRNFLRIWTFVSYNVFEPKIIVRYYFIKYSQKRPRCPLITQIYFSPHELESLQSSVSDLNFYFLLNREISLNSSLIMWPGIYFHDAAKAKSLHTCCQPPYEFQCCKPDENGMSSNLAELCPVLYCDKLDNS